MKMIPLYHSFSIISLFSGDFKSFFGKSSFLLFLGLFFLVIGSGNSVLAQLAFWNPAGQTGFGVSPFAATTTNANLTVTGLTRGSSVTTTSSAAPDAWGGNGWNDMSANDFVTWTMTANSGYQQSLSSFTLRYRRSSTGPNAGLLRYSIDGGAFVTIATLSFSSTAGGGADIAAVDLTGIADLQDVPAGSVVRFSIFPSGATNSGGTWYVYNGGSNGMGITGTVSSSVLPIELLDFQAVKGTAYVDLEWITASERDNDYFTIERSADGFLFEAVLTLDGAGTSMNVIHYTTRDVQPLEGTSYYRLKQTDFDGKTTYSDIRSVTFDYRSVAYPNPANAQFTISGNRIAEAKLIVRNVMGQEIPVSIQFDSDHCSLDTKELANGLYFVLVHYRDEVVVHEVVVQH